MFPYVCLATLPVFCDDDWPKRWIAKCPGLLRRCLPDATKIATTTTRENGGKYSAFKITLMGLYVVTQLVLPWSHSVTQVFPLKKKLKNKTSNSRKLIKQCNTTKPIYVATTGIQQLDKRPVRLLVGYDGTRMGDDARRSHGQRQNHWTIKLP